MTKDTEAPKVEQSIYIAMLGGGKYDVQCVGITLLSQVDRMIRAGQRELLKRRAYGKPLSQGDANAGKGRAAK